MPSPPLILPPGATLGGFDIEDVLGIGGMAVVYRAVQRSLGRRVALKVLNPRLAADATFRERFRREGSLVATLDHPNVIPVYDSGEADGRLYLAMRLVDGVTLADRMLDDALSPRETLDVIGAVASALDAAHTAGLLHRDIKPQNILLSHTGMVYLADFGVAKMAGSPDLTRTGGFMGSVTYVSPEHIRGEAVGPPTDVYALATVAYECLAGQAPFRRDTEASVIHAHLTDPPPPLAPTGDPVHASVSRALANGLEKDPADRPQTAGAFVAALRQALSPATDSLMDRRPGFERSAGAPPVAEPPAPEPTVDLDRDRPDAPPPASGPPARDTSAARGPGARRDPPRPAPRPAVEEHTIHDRRRDEFVPAARTTNWVDTVIKVLPVLALLTAVAIPLAVRSATKDEPIDRTEIGAVSVEPVPGWRSTAFRSLPADQAAGLQLDRGRRWTSPDGGSTIVAGELSSASRLTPVSLGEAEAVSQVKIPDGMLRRWSVGDPRAAPPATAVPGAVSATSPAVAPTTAEPTGQPALRAVAVASTEQGPLAVVCSGRATVVGRACDTLLASLEAEDGKLTADPDIAVGGALVKAIATAERSRASTLLPSKDRDVRARRAKLLARAYAASAKGLTSAVQTHAWDADLARVQAALQAASTAYTRIADAASRKDRTRDRRARRALREADRELRDAVGRFARRGYALRGA